MSAHSSRRAAAVAVALASLTAGGALGVDLTPEWIARLPVGPALTAGLRGIVVDAAGVAYVAGTSGSSSNTDVTTAAYRPDGGLLWAHTFDGPASWHDQARGLTLGADGRLYVVGNTPGPGSYANVLLLEYDPATGTLLDAVQFSSGEMTSEHGASVVADAAGNVWVAGGTVGDGGDALLAAFDADGELRWQRSWDGPADAPYSQDSALEIVRDPNGDLLVLVHGVMGSLHPDYVVLKVAPADGATIWEARWGVPGGDFPRDLEIDATGDVYVTGTGLDGNDKYSTIKLRGSDGALLWQAYDAAGAHDAAAALALDGAGGVYVTGAADPDGDHSNFNDNIHTVKHDGATGERLWTHLYGADCIGCYDVAADLLVDPAGHVFVAGETNSPPYGADAILLVLDGDTGLETARGTVSGAELERAASGILAFDAAGNLYDGGGIAHADTGALDMAVVKWTALASAPLFDDGFESSNTCAWSSGLGGPACD